MKNNYYNNKKLLTCRIFVKLKRIQNMPKNIKIFPENPNILEFTTKHTRFD